jgi:hypothetical protein
VTYPDPGDVGAKLPIEPDLPVLVGEPGSYQHIAPVSRGEIDRVAESADIARRKQHNRGLNPFTCKHFLVVTGPARKAGELLKNAASRTWIGEIAPDPAFQPQLTVGHGLILLLTQPELA